MQLLQADLVSEGKAHTDKIGTYTLFWSLLSTGSAERKRAEDKVDQQILATSQAIETLEDQSRKRASEQDNEAFQNKQRKIRSLQTLKEQEERTRLMLSKHADPTYTLTYPCVHACMCTTGGLSLPINARFELGAVDTRQVLQRLRFRVAACS